MKPYILLNLLGLLFVVSSCTKPVDAKKENKNSEFTTASAEEKVKIPVKILAAKNTNYTEFSDFFAEVGTIDEVTLTTVPGGKVKRIRAQEGSVVRRRQRLCDIDGNLADISLETANLNVRVLQSTHERNKANLKKGTVAQLQVDQSRLKLLDAQKARLNAKKVVEGAYCISPIAGTVIKKHINLHDDAKPGSPTFLIANLKELKLTIGVPETDINLYSKGNKVSITADSVPGKSWDGEITKTSESVDTQSRTLDVEVHIDNADKVLKPGQTVRARVQKYNLKNALVIPNKAIITHASKRVVMVANREKNVAEERVIEVKSSNETHSLLTSGVKEGDEIIISGQSQVGTGSPIQILN